MAEHNEHASSNEHLEHAEHQELRHGEHEELHIFVNQRRFDCGDGVKKEMTGAQIAALAGVPSESAAVREEEPHEREIGINEAVHIKDGDRFLVTELHIFVNRRRFDRGDGVKREMTGAQIAALVGVPPENAVVREEEPHMREIGIAETVHVKNGEHFLVTRKVVEGGYVA